MRKFDLVFQGECRPITQQCIDEYSKLPFVDRIILSTYANSICFDIPKHVEVVLNDVVEPAGTGNRNLQINTSRNGLAVTTSTYAAKMRTDQFIRPHSMQAMYNYWDKRHEDQKIFVLGMYYAFPYHPRDHVFWGRTEDVKNVFNVPYDQNPNLEHDYRYKTRAETYIGQFYYARFDPSIQEHINEPLKYLVDTAPKKYHALQKDYAMRDKVFVPFPKISMAWPSKGMNEYHYNIGEMYTEYWAND
jgi:hypothetical protein